MGPKRCVGRRLQRPSGKLLSAHRRIGEDRLQAHVFGQMQSRRTRLVGQIQAQGVQGGPAQVEAGVERAFHLHIKPGLNGARDELVGHRVDQQAWDKTHHHEN